jgi:hypothetical protein
MAHMIDESLARLLAHRNNVHRYRRLLKTQLTDLERTYIERRLSEEITSMQALSNSAFPLTFPMESTIPPPAHGDWP